MAAASRTSLPPRLLAAHADVQPAEFTLEGDLYTLGRSPMCDIVVARDVVSRLHAQIERAGPRYALRDMGSVNGTYVNNQRLHEPRLLAHKDAIGLGAPAAVLIFADPDPTAVRGGRLRYDEPAMRFAYGAQPLDLTPSQFRVLLHLYQRQGQVCSREACARAIWGEDYAPGLDADALDRIMSTLRSRLRAATGAGADLLQTRPGLGYLLNLDE
jgi:DNA-binding response OmpR family regulator